MSFFPYSVCALLGVDSLRGELAEGNRIYERPTWANWLYHRSRLGCRQSCSRGRNQLWATTRKIGCKTPPVHWGPQRFIAADISIDAPQVGELAVVPGLSGESPILESQGEMSFGSQVGGWCTHTMPSGVVPNPSEQGTNQQRPIGRQISYITPSI